MGLTGESRVDSLPGAMIKAVHCSILGACFFLEACVVIPDLRDQGAGVVEKLKGPVPDSIWNAAGIWYRIGAASPTYLPVGYSADLPCTDKEGQWIVDERKPGKKLYVPNVGANGLSSGVLEGEARKACSWKPREVRWYFGYDGQPADHNPWIGE